jgi:hypothetical protein
MYTYEEMMQAYGMTEVGLTFQHLTPTDGATLDKSQAIASIDYRPDVIHEIEIIKALLINLKLIFLRAHFSFGWISVAILQTQGIFFLNLN